MNAYFAYTRVSTVKQGERGSSLQEQKSAIEAYAASNRLPIVGWYEEMETAAKLGRRMFNRMLADLETGRARGVIIHKIDRSARNLKDWAHLGELIDRGVEVHFAHESLDLASRGGRLSADIQAVVAADYIRNLRQEVKKGFYGRLKQGFYPLPAPLGYIDRGKAQAKEIDPVRGPLVREMFELYATGRYPLRTLHQELIRRGLTTSRSGRSPTLNTIARALHNPFYVGIVHIRTTGETFQGLHQPLVPKATFDLVQQIMAGKAVIRTTRHGFAYRQLIKCARCGRSLVGERQKGRIYYRCHSQTCRGTSLREDRIDQQLSCFLKLTALSTEELLDVQSMGDQGKKDRERVVAAQRQQAQRALGLCEERLRRLTDALLDGDIEKDLFEERKAALLSERADLRDAVERPDPRDPFDAVLEKLELGNRAQQGHETVDDDQKIKTVELISSNLIADGKELGIEPRFPFSVVAKWRLSHFGGPCWAAHRTSGLYLHCVGKFRCPPEAPGAGRARERNLPPLLRLLVSKVPDVT